MVSPVKGLNRFMPRQCRAARNVGCRLCRHTAQRRRHPQIATDKSVCMPPTFFDGGTLKPPHRENNTRIVGALFCGGCAKPIPHLAPNVEPLGMHQAAVLCTRQIFRGKKNAARVSTAREQHIHKGIAPLIGYILCVICRTQITF